LKNILPVLAARPLILRGAFRANDLNFTQLTKWRWLNQLLSRSKINLFQWNFGEKMQSWNV